MKKLLDFASMVDSGSYLSKIILFQAILISTLVFLIFPLLIERKSGNIDEINMTSIRDTWQEDQVSLPVPTVLAISFTDHRILRWSIFSILIISGVLIEMVCQNKIASGTYHSLQLILCTFLGAYFWIGCLAPFIPL